MRKGYRINAALTIALITFSVFMPRISTSASGKEQLSAEGTYSFSSTIGGYVNNYDCFSYSDSCFMRSSFLGSDQLEVLSAQVSLASAGDTIGKTYNSENIADLLENMGFSDISLNQYYHSQSRANSCAAAVGRKTIMQDGKSYTLIAIIPRSAGYGQEWAGNFNVGSGSIHEGFKDARDEILRFVKQYIKEKNINGDLKVWTAGHSRGGAAANMIGAFFAGGGISYFGDTVRITPEDVYCCTFAAPGNIKPGTDKKTELSVSGNRSEKEYSNDTPDEPFISGQEGITDPSDKVYSGIRNYISDNDLLPLLPPQSWGFTHYGTDIPSDHGTVTTEDMLKELRNINPCAYNSYQNGKGADNFHCKTFDLKTLSIINDTSKNKDVTYSSFLRKRVSGLEKAIASCDLYQNNGYQETMMSTAGLFGMTSTLISEEFSDKKSDFYKPLICTYLAYASEQLQSEGKAADEPEAVALAIEELLGYFTGICIDHHNFTFNDFICLFAEYITENENEPVSKAVTAGIERLIPAENRYSLNSILNMFVNDNSYEDGVPFQDGLLAVLKACVNGPEPGCEASYSTSGPEEVRALIAIMLKNVIPELQPVLFHNGMIYDGSCSFSDAVKAVLPIITSVRDNSGTVISTYPDIAAVADDSLRSLLNGLFEKIIANAANQYGKDFQADIIKHLSSLNNNISKIRNLAANTLFYNENGFNTAANIENLSTIIGNISCLSLSHCNEVYLAYAKAAQSYDPVQTNNIARSDVKSAAYVQTSTASATQASSTIKKENGSPPTGDKSNNLPLTILTVALGITLISRKSPKHFVN